MTKRSKFGKSPNLHSHFSGALRLMVISIAVIGALAFIGYYLTFSTSKKSKAAGVSGSCGNDILDPGEYCDYGAYNGICKNGAVTCNTTCSNVMFCTTPTRAVTLTPVPTRTVTPTATRTPTPTPLWYSSISQYAGITPISTLYDKIIYCHKDYSNDYKEVWVSHTPALATKYNVFAVQRKNGLESTYGIWRYTGRSSTGNRVKDLCTNWVNVKP